MKTDFVVEGYKKALRLQKAANRNFLKFVGLPSAKTQENLKRRDVLDVAIGKEKQKMLYRATLASMSRDKGSPTTDTKAMNIARGIDDLSKLHHKGSIAGLVKAEPSKKITINTLYPRRPMGAFAFGPGKDNITDRIQKIHTNFMAGYEATNRKGILFKYIIAAAKHNVPVLMNARVGKGKSHIPVGAMPGEISLQNVSDMMRKIDRSNLASVASKMKMSPSSVPSMVPIPLKHLTETEKDSKGQMHFDFVGARIEREREEAADDRQFDKDTLYGRKVGLLNARKLLAKFAKWKAKKK